MLGTDSTNYRVLRVGGSGRAQVVLFDGAGNQILPNTAALADNTANPTLTQIATFPHWYDGSTWDRARGDSTNGLQVNTELPAAVALADNLSNPTTPLVGSANLAWHHSTSVWKRVTAPYREVLIASAARTAASAQQWTQPPGCRAVLLDLIVTVNPGGGRTLLLQVFRFTVNAFDQVTNLAAQAYGGGTGQTFVQLGPESATAPLSGTGSAAYQVYLTDLMQVNVTPSDGASWTYSVEVAYMA
jgi:hypothetical protein